MKVFLFKIITIFFIGVLQLQADQVEDSDKVFISKIQLDGMITQENEQALIDLLKNHQNKKLSFLELQNIRKMVDDFYKAQGSLYTKVIIPEQNISNGTFKLLILKAKIDKIEVVGNKYYSSEFIKNSFALESGDTLNYASMIESLMLMSELSDLKVKASPSKGESLGLTDIELQVEDENPFHFTLIVDNLGSKDTAKERVTGSLFYGNLLFDGDEIDGSYTLGISNIDTKLFQANYAFRVGSSQTKIRFGTLFANYIALGDFSVLNMLGDTVIHTAGIMHPLSRSIKNKINISLDYSNKAIKNYILNSISSEDEIDVLLLSTDWKYANIYNTLSSNLSVSVGTVGEIIRSSRSNQDEDFFKVNLRENYNRYVNDTNSLLFSLTGQYSPNLLPIVEMFSLGGLDTIRGFEPSQQISDSGFASTLEWVYHPKIDFEYFKDALQVGVFVDYGEAYVNEPVAGQEEKVALSSGGLSLKVNMKEKYFANVSLGVPLYSSTDIKTSDMNIYFVVGAKVW